MTLNYRLILHDTDPKPWIGLHEVRYSGGHVTDWSVKPARFVCDKGEGAAGVLHAMAMAQRDAQGLPVLVMSEMRTLASAPASEPTVHDTPPVQLGYPEGGPNAETMLAALKPDDMMAVEFALRETISAVIGTPAQIAQVGEVLDRVHGALKVGSPLAPAATRTAMLAALKPDDMVAVEFALREMVSAGIGVPGHIARMREVRERIFGVWMAVQTEASVGVGGTTSTSPLPDGAVSARTERDEATLRAALAGCVQLIEGWAYGPIISPLIEWPDGVCQAPALLQAKALLTLEEMSEPG